ncbi:MAG TPA: hypothetical protein VKJ47_01065 [Candidatus Binatia bacterium]|nr:hypothetical protein [Candidatus Binatia bacterium]
MSKLTLVPVAALPTPREGFIDCADIGCAVNALRLSTDCDEQLYLHCFACRHLLTFDLLRGWRLKQNSRAEIARRREGAREQYAPQIGGGWQELKRMRKVA